MKYFYSSFIIAFLGLVAAYFLGDVASVYIVFLLSILEISLSFDNAVVNAKILENMSEIWQDRFIKYGIPIAVFGMRFVFPLAIVAIATHLGLFETLNLAISSPNEYEKALNSHKDMIYIFGGAFLLSVFFVWFFDNEREIYWLNFIENNKFIRFLKQIPNVAGIFIIVIGLFVLSFSDKSYVYAYFGALIIHTLIASFDSVFGQNGVRNGVIGFLYLETLDASFSFDGVIGAFALSHNIFIIMIGLGVGAMFVRSMTLYLVKHKTLAKFVFLEHGAHYAILALGAIMILKTRYEISEIITGTIGFGFIALAFLSSVLKK